MINDFAEVSKLDVAIDAVLTEINDNPGSDENTARIDQLSKLTKIKETLVSLQLKELDLENKKTTETSSADLKSREMELKLAELSIKERQHNFDVQFKMREQEHKEHETSGAYNLKREELHLKKQESEKPDRVSKETWAIIGGNLAGIVAILGYEKANVIASKALSFVLKR